MELVSKYEGDLTKSKEENKDSIKNFAIIQNSTALLVANIGNEVQLSVLRFVNARHVRF